MPSARYMTPDECAAWYWTVTPGDDTGQLAALLQRWRVDPVAFCIEALRIIPQRYQCQIMLDLADAPADVYAFYGLDPLQPKRQVLVPSGHGLGKTRVEAVVIWWHSLTHAFSKRICTAPTGEQLTTQLWGEVRKMYRRLQKFWPVLANDWEVQATTVSHVNQDFGDWITVARTARPEKPEALQGAHALDADDEFGQLAALFEDEIDGAPSGGILVIAEEASGIDDGIRDVLEGALSEEGARFLACGNATRPDGWFATDIDRVDRYAVHALDCRMSDRTKTYVLPYRDLGGAVHELKIRGFVRPAYWEEILRECDGDEDSDRFRVRVRGMKPRSATEQVIRTQWLDEAEKRDPDPGSIAEPIIISLDFGLTSDKHGFAVRQGFNIREAYEYLPKDRPDQITLHAAQRAIDAQETYGAKYIIGDSNGVGRGAMEYLSKYFAERPALNVQVIHFNAGAGAMDATRFFTRRDEMWFARGRKFFADPRCYLPVVPGLKRQLGAVGYTEDTRRRVQVESKNDLKRRTGEPSGNIADAVLMSLMVHVVQEPAKAEPPREHPEPFEKHFKRCRAREHADRSGFIR